MWKLLGIFITLTKVELNLMKLNTQAFAAVAAMSDRICIHSNASQIVSVSAEDLIECCTNCGDGCDGGYSDRAWLYWQDTGIVTGGAFNTLEVCLANFILKMFIFFITRDVKTINHLHAITILLAYYLYVMVPWQHLDVSKRVITMRHLIMHRN